MYTPFSPASALLNLLKVPEDLQMILTDSSLHNGSAELTTKEILTRYRDIGSGHMANVQRTVETGDATAQAPPSAAKNSPIATRVDIDPYQANAWQKQSSVRHVQNTTGGAGMPNTQQALEYSTSDSPYARDRSASQDSLGQPGAQSSFHSKPGTIGLTS